jgi:cytoskeletal protein RodZ
MAAKFHWESSDMGSGEERLNLRELREACGLTVNDVSQVTKISTVNLEAIENENYQELPPPVYTNSYIRTYTKLLNADERQFIRRYEKYLTDFVEHNEEESDQSALESRSHTKKIVLAGSVVAIFCILGFFIYSQLNFRADKVQKSQAESGERPAEVKVLDEGVRSEGTKDVATMPDNKTSIAPDRLIIEAQEETWLRITEDSNKSYQILMKPGERLERSAPSFTIDVGNAGGITLELRGNKMKKLGKSGEVVHIRLP